MFCSLLRCKPALCIQTEPLSRAPLTSAATDNHRGGNASLAPLFLAVDWGGARFAWDMRTPSTLQSQSQGFRRKKGCSLFRSWCHGHSLSSLNRLRPLTDPRGGVREEGEADATEQPPLRARLTNCNSLRPSLGHKEGAARAPRTPL